ncbi:MAG: (2Fe-2S)-binding protein [Desulfurococcales archaeon ex4484_58]|nr:MAG: (2Fe-2S)-binding protein [Desulfurococcales archaeon ex4484_58]
MKVRFILNNREVEVDVDPREILLDTLRYRFGLKSVKRGCERGECGTCTVLINDKPVYSCMVLTVQVEGQRITTVEGLVNDDLFKKIIVSFAEKGAIQCGFCTPGFILTAYALYRIKDKPSIEDILKALEGNLCRCTGYKKIVDALTSIRS